MFLRANYYPGQLPFAQLRRLVLLPRIRGICRLQLARGVRRCLARRRERLHHREREYFLHHGPILYITTTTVKQPPQSESAYSGYSWCNDIVPGMRKRAISPHWGCILKPWSC